MSLVAQPTAARISGQYKEKGGKSCFESLPSAFAALPESR
jgi:hypothetical protein